MTLLLLLLAVVPRLALAEGDSSLPPELRDLPNAFGPEWIDGGAPAKTRATVGRSLLRRRNKRAVRALPDWIPMCFLVDAAMDEAKVNEALRGLVASYAECQISIEVRAVTIKAGYSDDPEALRAAALAACPTKANLGAHGTVQLLTRSAELPRKMCGDPAAKGCSTLCNPTSFSIIGPEASAADVLHESMHGNCCGPVCVDKGAGTGVAAGVDLELARLTPRSPRTRFATTGTSAVASLPIPAAGCAALRAGATANDGTHLFDPGRTAYYSAELNPSREFDLTAKQSLLPPKPLATPPPVAAIAGSDRGAPSPQSTPPPVGEPRKRSKAARDRGLADYEPEEASGDSNVGEERKEGRRDRRGRRGKALRKAGSIVRKSREGDFEVNGLYGGGGGGGEAPADDE